MTNHVVRLYTLAVALIVLFLAWAAIAARPWTRHASAPDPRVRALIARQHRLQRETLYVRRLVARRWRRYRVQLEHRRKAIAAAVKAHQRALAAAQAAAAASYSAPSYSSGGGGSYAAPAVRVVTLPPITITRTS